VILQRAGTLILILSVWLIANCGWPAGLPVGPIPGAPRLATPTDPCNCETSAFLRLNGINGNLLSLTITNGLPGRKYDVYFRNSFVGENWRWRCVYNGIQCDSDGKTSFQLQKPEPGAGVFVLLDGGDDDGDGLSNGYECLFNYNGLHTACNNSDSDHDGLNDGWEV